MQPNRFSQNFHLIIEGLYLSDYAGAYNISFLKSHAITHIVVCARELGCRFKESFIYLHIDLDDTATSNLMVHLEKTSDFIKNARTRGGNVLVHCAMGKSRSPSIVIAYLIRYEGFNYENAFELVHRKHRRTFPQIIFRKQLKMYC